MPAIAASRPHAATPRIDMPMSPPFSCRVFSGADKFEFERLLASAVELHEQLHLRSLQLEAENQHLRDELSQTRTNMGFLQFFTPRPDDQPIALTPKSSVQVQCTGDGISPTASQPGLRRVQINFEGDMEDVVKRGSTSQKTLISVQDSRKGLMDMTNALSESSRYAVNDGRSRSEISRTVSEIQRADVKKMHEIRRKFNRIDRTGRGEVEPEWLEDMLTKVTKKKGRRPSITNGSVDVPDVSCLAVIKAVSNAMGEEETILRYPTFVELMMKDDLQDSFEYDIVEKILAIRAAFARDEMTKMVARFSHLATHDLAMAPSDRYKSSIIRYLDPVSLCAILLNSVLLGVSADVEDDWNGWNIIEYFFTLFFVMELIAKFNILGADKFLFGKDAIWNFMDFVIVCFAVVDSLLNIIVSSDTSNMQLFTILRLVRLARITRLVRLLRFKIFKELLLMIRGVFAGMRTLLWAIVLLSLFIFMCGMLMRQTIGRWCRPEIRSRNSTCKQPTLEKFGEQLFSTLPRACLTVFRCFTEGCSAPDGTPLIVHIYEADHGPLIVLCYVMSFLFVTFGLFNLIMAIFVENTMESAKYDERKRQQMRHLQAIHVAHKLQKLVLKFCKVSSASTISADAVESQRGIASRLMNAFDILRGRGSADDEADLMPVGLEVEISRESFSKVVAEPQVEQLLDDLEVAVTDPMDLFDTLDADGSGSIDVSELIKGLMKLRGTAEKSDMVACLLAVRAMQKSLSGFEVKSMQRQKEMRAGQDKVDTQIKLLDQCLQRTVPGYREESLVLAADAAARRAKREEEKSQSSRYI